MITNCTPTHPLNVRFQLVYEPYLGDAENDLVLYQTSYHIVRFHIIGEIQEGFCRTTLAWFEVKCSLVSKLRIAYNLLFA